MTAVVVLRYFEALGRAQALRHALADAGIAFEDVRMTVGTWPPHKNDPAFSGPFGSLPTLTWDGVLVAEALPIATFLAKRLGHYEGLGDAAIGRIEAVTSCAYVDVIIRLAELLWCELLFPGADLAKAAPRAVPRAIDKLARIDADLGARSWFGGERPTVADFMAAEALETARYVLGPAHDTKLRARVPRLLEHGERLRARPFVAAEWTRRPSNLTASPAEVGAIERIRAFDAASIGL